MSGDSTQPPEIARDERAMFRALVDRSSELVVVTDALGTVRYASPASYAALGYQLGAHDGRSVIDLLHPDEVADLVESLASTAEQPGVNDPVDVRLRTADGGYRRFEIIATNLLDDPDVGGLVFHGRDLTERHAQERLLRMFFEQSPIASAIARLDGGVVANHELARLVGYSREELLRLGMRELVAPEDYRRASQDAERQLRAGNVTATNEARWVRKDGSRFWARTTTRMLYDPSGEPESLFFAVVDISSERESRDRLAESERRFRAIVDNSTDIIAVLEPDGHWSASAAGTRQLGYPRGFDPEGGVFSLVHPDELGLAAEALAEVLDGRRGPMDPILLRLRDADGQYHYYECVGQNLGNEAAVGGVVITARNVDKRHQLEAQLAWDATHDPLTRLQNRAAFMITTEHALARRTRTNEHLAVMFIDLDRFKQVNDTLGHHAGDIVLQSVARRIEGCVRDSDTVARLGGDEFVVLCEDLDAESRAAEIGERIVQAIERRITIGDREAFVGASVGIAFAQSGQGASDLLRDADAAVYRAKQGGRARVERFDDAMRADTAARVSLEVALRHALERDEVGLEYQPVIAVATGLVESFLARPVWTQDGVQHRGAAIRTLADGAGLGRVLDTRVLSRLATEIPGWADTGDGIRVFLSPTARHLRAGDFDHDLAATLGEPSGAVCLGVPEDWLADDTGVTAAIVARLREQGWPVAVDGFGRARSSLADLRKVRVDVVRLDPSFAFGLAVDAPGAAIVSAVVGLASALDLRVLADGVDDVAHLAALFTLRCDYATGNVVAPPVDAATAATLLGTIAAQQPAPNP